MIDSMGGIAVDWSVVITWFDMARVVTFLAGAWIVGDMSRLSTIINGPEYEHHIKIFMSLMCGAGMAMMGYAVTGAYDVLYLVSTIAVGMYTIARYGCWLKGGHLSDLLKKKASGSWN